MTLNEVVAGLRHGKSFRREVAGIVDTLRPTGDGRVTHSVYNERSGGGGEAELNIDTLKNGRWPSRGWMPA